MTLPEDLKLDRPGWIVSLSGLLLALLLAAMMMLPVPWAIQRPGPTVDTLGVRDGEPIVTVPSDLRHEDSEGELRLTTVRVAGGPGDPVNAFEVVEGWARRDARVVPREEAFNDGEDAEQISDFQQAQMAGSQTNAAAAALQELGYEVPMVLRVAETIPGSNAGGLLRADDVLTAVSHVGAGERVELVDFRELTDFMRSVPPGSEIEVEFEREGEAGSVVFSTSPRPEDDDRPGSVLGVYVSTDVTLPVPVEFDLDNIGGPSAGAMFALAVVDVMTPGDLTGGEVIAGTGTMSIDGYVGPIGGVGQKMFGAVRDGADWFLAPSGNCDEVAGREPEGLTVVVIEDLAQAVDVVEAIAAGETDDLPTCG
ncbi:MAG: YlbL family protein [Actinomycetota bacterium]